MKLSAVVATYNHADYLVRCLTGLLAQTRQADEIIVVDDASTDGTGGVLAGFVRQHPSIRVVTNSTNLGVCRAFNRGLEEACGDYVFLGADDDETRPDLFLRLAGGLDAVPAAGLAFANEANQWVGGPVAGGAYGWCDTPAHFPPDAVARRLRSSLPGHAIVIRTDLLRGVGGFRPPLRWYSDWFAWTVVALRHGVVHVPEVLAVRVFRPDAYSVRRKDPVEHKAVMSDITALLESDEFADVGESILSGVAFAALLADH